MHSKLLLNFSAVNEIQISVSILWATRFGPRATFTSFTKIFFLLIYFCFLSIYLFVFYVTNVLPACMSEHWKVGRAVEASRECWDPLNLESRALWATMPVLGTKPKSEKAAGSLCGWHISSVSFFSIFKFVLLEFIHC